jgi:hypothetical protein
MKAAILTLLISLAFSLGLLGYQHYSHSARYERQNQAIALVEKRYQASLRENESLKTRKQIQERSRTALSQAQPIAARYQKLHTTKNSAHRVTSNR